jgi:hypothetical protein
MGEIFNFYKTLLLFHNTKFQFSFLVNTKIVTVYISLSSKARPDKINKYLVIHVIRILFKFDPLLYKLKNIIATIMAIFKLRVFYDMEKKFVCSKQ